MQNFCVFGLKRNFQFECSYGSMALTVGHENENEIMAKNLINLYFLNNILKCLIVILNSHHAAAS